ncbi:MAG TPA: hypothetical protein VME69_10365, partial [Methylocella sp.]|nr:hypothetical protein [Methylocella sp.]
MSRHCHAMLAVGLIFVAMATLLWPLSLFPARAAPESQPIDSPAFLTKAHFLEPLIAMAPSTSAEDEALEGALARYEERQKPDDLSALTEFLARHKDSPWRVALNLNLGLAWKHYGYLSRALGAFEEAWRAGKEASGTYQKPLVDRAVGELALLHAGLGHKDELEALLAEIGDRPLSNPGGQSVATARQTLWGMENDPAHRYLCGPLALKFLMMEKPAVTSEELRFVNRYRAGPNGVSLAELARLAGEKNLSLTPVFRQADQPVPVPSIIHWKTGHYAAILGRENGGYRVRDPVLGMNPRFVPEGAIEAEAS